MPKPEEFSIPGSISERMLQQLDGFAFSGAGMLSAFSGVVAGIGASEILSNTTFKDTTRYDRIESRITDLKEAKSNQVAALATVKLNDQRYTDLAHNSGAVIAHLNAEISDNRALLPANYHPNLLDATELGGAALTFAIVSVGLYRAIKGRAKHNRHARQ